MKANRVINRSKETINRALTPQIQQRLTSTTSVKNALAMGKITLKKFTVQINNLKSTAE